MHDGPTLREVARREPLVDVWLAAAGIPRYQWGVVRARAMRVLGLREFDARRYLVSDWPLTDEPGDVTGAPPATRR